MQLKKIIFTYILLTFFIHAIDGKSLFKKCASCHGDNAELHAMGSSKIIKGWSIIRLEKIITLYKRGTYGFCLKNVMREQVRFLSDDEIKAVSLYISKL